ncbi:sel1 repeat family protein [Archangium gephyra]|uniref:tetratricopeptide repeat protein n=1 Tax=Archangium gephyra TaxID=48 RepID=UPI0035D48FDC
MKRSLLAVSVLVGLLAVGGLVFVRSRQPAAAPPAPSAAAAPVASAPPVAPASKDPLLAEIDCVVATPPTCKVKGSAASFGHNGTRLILRTLARSAAECHAGKLASCLDVGIAYEQGTVVEPRPDRAAALYERACGQGLSDGCRYLLDLYRQAKGVPRDDERAKALKQRALELDCAEDPTATGCEALLASRRDVPDAGLGTATPVADDKASTPAHDEQDTPRCGSLAFDLVYERDGVKLKDEVIARLEPCLKPLCDAGDAACASQGKPGGVDPKPDRDVYLQRFCDAGHADSCHRLARSVELSSVFNPKEEMQSIVKRRTSALRLDERACALGNALSCAEVGEAYESGFPVEKELERALDAYTRECELNGANGCMKEASLAGPVEPERVTLALLRARVNYEDGCDPENAPSPCKLAADLFDGRSGLDTNPERRAELYRLAVPGLESGCDTDADACRELIALHEQGLGGLERDEAKLSELRQKLCSHTMDCDEPEEAEAEAEDNVQQELSSDEESAEPEPSADSEME